MGTLFAHGAVVASESAWYKTWGTVSHADNIRQQREACSVVGNVNARVPFDLPEATLSRS